MKPYMRRVQYHETDMMGIAHHANYIRWMEEARVDFLAQLGFPYRAMEEMGVVSPVRAVRCQYKKSCTFDDEIAIEVSVKDFNGVVLTIGYEMTNAAGEVVCTAESEHVFLTREGKFLRMKRDLPEFTAAVEALAAQGKAEE